MLRKDVYGFGLTTAEAERLSKDCSDADHIYLYDTPLADLDSDEKRILCRACADLTPERFSKLIEYAFCIIVRPENVPDWMLSTLVQKQERLIRQNRPVPVMMSVGEFQQPEPERSEQFPMNADRKAQIERKKCREKQTQKQQAPLNVLCNMADFTGPTIKPKKIGLMRMLNVLNCPVDQCCRNLEAMKTHDFRSAWYLLDIRTENTDGKLICIRLAKMEQYEIAAVYPTLYLRQDGPVSEMGYAEDFLKDAGASLKETVEEVNRLLEPDIPLLGVARGTYEAMETAFRACGENFEPPYIDMSQLARIPFGYLLETNTLNIPRRMGWYKENNDFLDGRLWEEYLLTKHVFQQLSAGYGVHCPADIEKKLV